MKQQSSNKRVFLILFLVVATELIGFGLIIPVLPQIAHQFQTNGLMLGMLLATYSAAQFFAGPILGGLSDKYGRRPVLILSKLGTVISYLILAKAGSFWMIFLSRLIDGTTGGNISVARAYVADITTPENRSKGMALIGIAFGVGFVVGPGLGGLLYQSGSHAIPALVAGGLSLLALIGTIIWLDEPSKKSSLPSQNLAIFQWVKHINTSTIKWILILQLVYMIIFSGFETTFALYNLNEFGFDKTQNSLMFFVIGLFGLVIQGGLARRTVTNTKRVVGIGVLVVAFSYVCLSLVTTVQTLILALGIMALGIGLVMIYLPTLLSHETTANHVGAVMGIYESMGSLARVLGPLIAYLTIYNNIRLGYLMFGISLVVMSALFLMGYQKQKEKNT